MNIVVKLPTTHWNIAVLESNFRANCVAPWSATIVWITTVVHRVRQMATRINKMLIWKLSVPALADSTILRSTQRPIIFRTMTRSQAFNYVNNKKTWKNNILFNFVSQFAIFSYAQRLKKADCGAYYALSINGASRVRISEIILQFFYNLARIRSSEIISILRS